MIKVLFLPEVVDQFLELAEVLYNKGYLGFKDIQTYIPKSRKMPRHILTDLDKAFFTHYSQEIIIPHGTYFTVSMKLMIRPYT